jgi:hypothetical protein
VSDGLEIQLVASEPAIRQPVLHQLRRARTH